MSKPGARQASGLDQADDAWTRDEPAMDAQTAPGDGEALQMSSSKLGDPASVRFNWAVALGRIWSGSGAGRIRISESRLGTNVYTPAILTYAPPASQTNEIAVVMDLDDTNCLSQISAPQTLVTVDPLYGSALLSAADLLNVTPLVQKLTNSQPDAVSQFLWTNFSSSAQQVLTNSSSTLAQQQSTLLTELNRIVQGSSIYDSLRFSGVNLSGRTSRLLLVVTPLTDVRTRLNRFLLEDTYPSDVARLGFTQFDLNFYLASAAGPVDILGFFTLQSGSSPFVTWRLGLPEGSTNQWRLQEIRNGATNISLLAFTPASGLWTLTRGTGADARVETRTIVTNSVAGVVYSTETQEVKNGANLVCDRTVEVFQHFDWGYELVNVTNDPGGANLVTTFTFDSNTNNPGSGGKLLSIVYPDGFWERREYSTYDDPIYHPNEPLGALLRVVQPWENSDTNAATADCLVTDYGYSSVYQNWSLVKWHAPVAQRPDNWPANFSETYDPLQVGILADYGIYSEKTFLWNDLCAAQDLSTETREIGSLAGYGEFQDTTSFGPSYGRLSGQLYSKEYDTTRTDSYDYEFGLWDASSRVFTPAAAETDPNRDVRQTILHGVSPDGNAIGDIFGWGGSGARIADVALEPGRSTMEVRIIQGGNLAAKELYVYAGNLTDFALIDQVIYQRDCLGHATNVFRVDPTTHQSRVIYQADWQGNKTWPADLRLSEVDETGIVYTNAYDSLKRLQIKTKLAASGQAPLVTSLSYDAAGRTLTNIVSGGSLSLKTITHFDLAGRLTDETGPDGLTTTYSYQNGGRQTTITQSSGATTIISKNLDRQVASITGTAVTNQFYHYAVDLAAPTSEDTHAPRLIKTINLGSDNSARWTGTYTDHRGHVAREFKPAFANTNSIYKNLVMSFRGHIGQPDQVHVTGLKADGQVDPIEGFVTGFTYDLYGQRIGQNIDGPDLGTYTWGYWNLASTDRITTWTNFYEADGQGAWFHVAEQWTYPYDNDATPSLVERTRQRFTGFSATEVSETQTFDADTNQTTVKVTVDLPNKKVTTTTTVAQSTLSGVQVVINGLLQTESTPTVATPTYHYYDNLGREIGIKDPLGNLSGTRYDPFTGQVTAKTNAQGLVTTMQYYSAGGTNAGLLYCQTGPTGKKTYYNYNGARQVIQTWGDVAYPEKRDYNPYGELVKLTTYRGGTSWSGASWPANTGPTADATQWFYDEATGLLTNKTDAAGRFVSYSYYDNYYPKSRVWARGVGNTNIYSSNGDLIRVDYSDGTSVAFTSDEYPDLNRLGKPAVVIDASGTNLLTYDHAGRLVSTFCTNGLLAGITVTNHFDPVHGRDALQVLGLALPITHNFAYDAIYGRLASVSSGIYSASYDYQPNSDLLQKTTCKSNTTVVLTTTRTWETGPRLRSIVNVANNTVVTSHDYGYDALDRRKSALLEDGSRWQYGYDDRDELTAGRRYWSDWSPVSGEQFEYGYDNIGNRTLARSGGDTNGANLRETDYTANSLNQYTTITTPGYEDILGVGMATNTVGVTNLLTGIGGLADRKGEYFHREIAINNTNAPVWQSVKVACGGSSTNGGLVFPAYNQTNTYDLDGNLTFDGVWTYEWDGENRLKAMSMTNLVNIDPSNYSNRLRLDFVYDYQGRRVSKTVSAWSGNGNVFTNVSTTLFVYDGWNLVTTLTSDLRPQTSFLWGQDLSGTEDGAGGIGGLLAAFEIANNQVSNCHFVSYDGNGNVTALVRAADRWVSARYEYSPYGETLRITGPMAQANPFRFSTKFADDESGLVAYPKRVYHPQWGRWLGRDSSGEDGGLNLYTMVDNSPLNAFDPLGLAPGTLGDNQAAMAIGENTEAGGAEQASAFYHRVKGMVDNFNDLQEFMDGVMDASNGDISGLMQVMKERAGQIFSKSDNREHHVLPLKRGSDKFAKVWAEAGLDPDKFMVNMEKILHGKIHGRGGGKWNKAWEMFIKIRQEKSPGPIKPERIMGFAFSMLQNIGMEAVPFL